MPDIIYQSGFLSREEVEHVRQYFDRIGDRLDASRGPRPSERSKLGWQGCWDRQLHYELEDSPVHEIIRRLQYQFGDFKIADSSIRYLSAPFLPHTDIKSLDWMQEFRRNGYQPGHIFLIPLWWHEGCQPGTAVFSNPVVPGEPLYSDLQNVLPEYSDDHKEESRNFSVRQVLWWQQPGDLVAWENFQWHSSCHRNASLYRKDSWVKEFVSIETYRS